MFFDPIWQPTAKLSALQARANILAIMRGFFADRKVLEVETPLLARFGVTDPHIMTVQVPLSNGEIYYLQTSPEYSMKRLLAAGSGPIYQITKAFRGGDSGNEHNPEFTMLEWYRPGFDHFQLMAEITELLQMLLPITTTKQATYQELFKQYLGIDPHCTTIEELQNSAKANDINCTTIFIATATLDNWLDILFAYCIEPKLTGDTLWLVYDYPASQAALAKITVKQEVAVAERFEVYYQGLELANGYHELTDPHQQLARFEQDNKQRAKLQKPLMAIDDRLLAALTAGVPECAGVALGVDRLIMLYVGATDIQDVIAFPFVIA